MINRFKKKALALVLASVVTVAGSFAAGNYKNTLVSIKASQNAVGNIGLMFETKEAYSGEIAPRKIAANKYVITLPEFNANSVRIPSLEKSAISSINVSTMPYTSSGNGYSRITVTLKEPKNIECFHRVYIESADRDYLNSTRAEEIRRAELIAQEENARRKEQERQQQEYTRKIQEQERLERQQQEELLKKQQQQKEQEQQAQNINKTEKTENNNTNLDGKKSTTVQNKTNTDNFAIEEDNYESLLLAFAIVIMCAIIGAIVYKAKTSMQDIAGESMPSEDRKNNTEKKKDKPKAKRTVTGTINKVDSQISKYGSVTSVRMYSQTQKEIPAQIEKLDVVDLDELLKEQTKEEVVEKLTDEDNQALDEFLNNFDFGDAENIEDVEEEENIGYDIEYYEKVINSQNIKFSAADISKIKMLIKNEIGEDTIKNIDQYAITNPIKDNPEKRIEDIITTFTIYQNIKFSKKDLAALHKLSCVELDKDFTENLTVDKKRTEAMAKDIQKERPLKIEAEEQKILTVKNDLPNLSKEIKNKDSYISKPSAGFEYVDTSYEVSTLKLDVELPDLQDVLKHPEKYEEKPAPKAKIDENTLLNRLADVQFKPFDDGSREFEILNNPEDFIQHEITEEVNSPKKNINHEENNKNQQKMDLVKLKATIAKQKSEIAALQNKVEPTQEKDLQYIFDGVSYSIVSSVQFATNVGINLAKCQNGYIVLGYIGNNITELRRYETLKTEKISLRINETLEDGTARCLVKVGINKFVVDINGEHIKYVMDLC